MAETGERRSEAPKNLFSLIPKIDFKIPFLNRNPRADAYVEESKPKTTVAGGPADGEGDKRIVARVSFPYGPPKVSEPLEAEFQPCAGSTSNPVVLWQVYAFGGFLVLNWVWGRWKERKERRDKKDLSNDESVPPADEEFQDCS